MQMVIKKIPDTLNQFKINLWGTNLYGFGIGGNTLMYSSQTFHSLYNSSSNLNTFSIDSSGNTTINGEKLIVGNSISYPEVQLGSINGHNLGFQQQLLHFQYLLMLVIKFCVL